MLPTALTIAGSDPSGGAGLQADLKTFHQHGVYGMSVVTLVTAQNTRGVTAVHVPPLDFLQAQLDACFADFDIHAVKLGMLANAEVISLVADALEKHRPPHIILDPVMVATSGAKLLEDSALHALRTRLLPLASLVTPNTPEAELLLGRRISNGEQAEDARAGPAPVLALHDRGDDRADGGGQHQRAQHVRRGAALLAHGATINGLAVLDQDPELETHYQSSVIGGPGHFLLAASDYADFQGVIRRKLLRELRPLVAARQR